MNNKWLILDCNFLCHRAHYSLKGLSHDEIPTGVVYGFFKDIVYLMERFDTGRIAFCFDYGRVGRRSSIFAGYKSKRHRHPTTPEEEAEKKSVRRQIVNLRDRYLPSLGYKNVFYQRGYESDDIIASLAQCLPDLGDEGVIITADGDLLQCVSPYVTFHNPTRQKTVTVKSFKEEWGIHPQDWWKVKALAGCKSDEVTGIKGVGEKTAVKYLLGELKPSSKVYQAIRSEEGRVIRKRNIRLVRLPMQGTKLFSLQSDSFDVQAWEKLSKELGFRTFKSEDLVWRKRKVRR